MGALEKRGVLPNKQGDAPDEALELKMLNNNSSFINVRFAGDPDCSADLA